MEFSQLLSLVLHVDKSLDTMLLTYGPWVYAVLFAIVFAETGLVVFPFLPGDTLLFVGGAFCANGAMHAGLLILLLVLAAVIGNTVNYYVGRAIGQQVYTRNYRWLDRQSLEKTHAFFDKHGGKTIVIARWLPVVRTFAPFVAGIGTMSYLKFATFNITGGVLWVTSFLFIGYFFGGLPVIKDNFTYVIFGIIILSILPPVIELIREKNKVNS